MFVDAVKGNENTVKKPYTPAIENNDIVELMILGISMPQGYINKLNKENVEIEKSFQQTGIPQEKMVATWAEGGMSMQVAVLRKWNEEDTEEDFIDRLDVSKFLYHSIIMQTPTQYYERGFNIKSERRGGHITTRNDNGSWDGAFRQDSVTKELLPEIQEIYPSPSLEVWWMNGQKYKTVDEITATEAEDNEAKKVLNKEKKRLKGWDKLRSYWKNITEEHSRNFLALGLSSRFLLYNEKDVTPKEYFLPTPGMIFTAKVQRKENSKYVNFISHEWDFNIGERGAWTYFNNGVHKPTAEDIELLEKVKRAKDTCFS
jgi:hypothetical protein